MSEDFNFDSIAAIENLQKEISSKILTSLFIHATIKIVEPRSIEIGEMKTKRIIDKRSEI